MDFSKFSIFYLKNGSNGTYKMMNETKSWKMSSFGASTEESRGITYMCGHKVPPPCSIGLRNHAKIYFSFLKNMAVWWKRNIITVASLFRMEHYHDPIFIGLMPNPSARTKLFWPGQNNFCPRQKFFPRLKSSYLLGKRIENDFKLWTNYFPWLKSYFPSTWHAKIYFSSPGQNFLSGTKTV